jgi:hypothetical protein
LGLGDVFRNFSGGPAQPPWTWGISKLLLGALGFGLGAAGGGGPTGSGVPRLPLPQVPGGGNDALFGGPAGKFWGPRPGPPPKPGDRATTASYVYQQAKARGYSDDDAVAIVAYAVGESGLNPTISGGVQGDDEVIGLFQEKAGFARAGGIDPSQRNTIEGNVLAYLNNLDKHRGQGDILDQLLATSVGGPMHTGGRSYMQTLIGQARGLLGSMAGGGGPASAAPSAFRGGLGPAASSAIRSSGKLATDTPSTADPRHGGIPSLPSGQGEDVVGWMESQVDAYNAAHGTNLRISADYPGGPHGHPDDGGQHSVGHAIDIAGTPSEMAQFAKYWTAQAQLVADTRQLIHNNPGFDPGRNVIGGRFTSGPSTYAGEWAEHGDHIHLAVQDIPGVLDVRTDAFAGAGMPSSPAAPASFGGFGLGRALSGLLGGDLPMELAQLTNPLSPASVVGHMTPPRYDPSPNAQPASYTGPTYNLGGAIITNPSSLNELGAKLQPYVQPPAPANHPAISTAAVPV